MEVAEEINLNPQIRSLNENDVDAIVRLTLLAFEPIFTSFDHILGPEIYSIIYPDWRKSQADGVNKLIKNEKIRVWVAEVDGRAIGLITCELHEDKTGDVRFLAVHPDFQNQGVGTQLNTFALQKMKEAGMKLAVVSTGGDESHAPARRSYEKAGYTALPLVRYYKVCNPNLPQ